MPSEWRRMESDMSSKNFLTNEQKVILLTGRFTFNENEINELRNLMRTELDWSVLFSIAIRHKMLALFWYNINKYCPGFRVTNPYRQVATFHYLGTKQRNEIFFNDFNKIRMKCKENHVYIYPTKGGYLIPYLYQEFGVRTINDIDCLIRKDDIEKLRKVLNDLGYIEGEYDRTTKEVRPVVRQKQIMWVRKLSNLFPFQKKSDSPYIEFFDYDFCFSFNKDTEPVNDIINRSVLKNTENLKPSDFFIHLCYHLLREAKSAVAILYQVDLNIIKFCDIREFLINKMNENDCIEAIKFAQKFNLEDSIYFTLYYLIEIYDDDIAKWMLSKLELKDTNFMNSYGDVDFSHIRKWKKSFWDRLFAYSNKDEIEDIPEFAENFFKYH